MPTLRIPLSSYRFQFNQSFRFVDGRDLVPYLHDLGITDLYSSPRFKACRGSSHGYDVAHPSRINSELGSEEEFDEMAEKLQSYDMGLILDIVPNHMAASSENPWWLDVLENGPSSAYAIYFDIDWHPATSKAAFLQENRIMLPVLGDLYGNVLQNQELTLKIDENGFFVRYYDNRLPLDPKSWRFILDHSGEQLRGDSGDPDSDWREMEGLLQCIDQLPVRTALGPEQVELRRDRKETIRRKLWQL